MNHNAQNRTQLSCTTVRTNQIRSYAVSQIVTLPNRSKVRVVSLAVITKQFKIINDKIKHNGNPKATNYSSRFASRRDLLLERGFVTVTNSPARQQIPFAVSVGASSESLHQTSLSTLQLSFEELICAPTPACAVAASPLPW